MSKHDHKWEAAGQASAADLGPPLADAGAASRNDSLIRFLAAEGDWQAAAQRLSGAFAEDEAVRLRREREE